ncbi:MAG: methionine--tRNA ligase [Kiritimatiellia bacterium]
MEKRKIIVTSALPYANGALHLGHLVEYLQTDFWVRFQKMMGNDCVYVCADDTHGTPIMIRARKENIAPEQLIAKTYEAHTRDFAGFEMHFDRYGSTNAEENRLLSEGIYLRLKEKGLISSRSIQQLYCEKEGMFLPDRFVKGTCPKCGAKDQYGDSCEVCGATYGAAELVEPYCSVCGAKPIFKASEQLFFELEPFRDFLRQWIPAHTESGVANKLLEWFGEPLRGWNISRDAPYFGFRIPGYDDKYFYVWLDAPVGYMATLWQWCKARGETLENWWQDPKAEIYHFIGKDIVRFHCLFWPALLENSGYRTPSQVFVHGFLTVNGEKMSKSKGTFISAETYLKFLPAQALRFYYACKLNGTADDMDLNLDDFANRVNSDLIGKISNLAARGAMMLHRNCEGRMGVMDADSKALLVAFRVRLPEILKAYELRDFCRVMVLVREMADEANKLFDAKAPWALVKTDLEQTRAVLTGTLNLFRFMAIVLKPILPAYVDKVETLFGEAAYTFEAAQKELHDSVLAPYEHLAQRIDPVAIEAILEASRQNLQATAKTLTPAAPVAKPQAQKKKAVPSAPMTFPEPLAETIDFETFSQVDLRVATVVAAEIVEGSDKLLRLSLEIGEARPRQVFAGIRKSYAPEELLGQQVVMVANLAPRKMRFGLSEGMVVASTDRDGSFRVMQPLSPTQPGARLH